MKKFLALLGAGLVTLVAVMAFRATQLQPRRIEAGAMDAAISAAAITTDRFAATLRFPTISTQDSAAFDPKPFLALHDYLRSAFPRVDSTLTREVVNGLSLLYT